MIKLIDIKIETDLNKFPYLQDFVKKFNPPLDKVVFVHGTTLFTKDPSKVNLAIKYHELTHMRQQEEVGIDNWFSEYLNNPEKRLKWEIEAYKAERGVLRTRDWKQRMEQIVPYLAGDVYGNLVTREQAFDLLSH